MASRRTPPTAILADRRDHNQTLAAVLKARLNLTWTKAKQTIERRHVRVAGQIVADPAYRVKSGKRITIAAGALESPAGAGGQPAAASQKVKAKIEKPRTENRKPKAVPITIIYVDTDIVVVNKPAGLTTTRNADETAEFGDGKKYLPKTLQDLVPKAMGEPKAKLFAVHRLDRDTSGLVAFARTSTAAKGLAKQFKSHTVERKYLAWVRGQASDAKLESTFVDDRGDGRRGSGDGGVPAVTHVKVLKSVKGFSFVECRLETGRTHQVRIHLGEAGTPLCGERLYDRPIHGTPLPDASGAKRPLLHAAVLGFAHPTSGEIVRFEIEPPADFAVLAVAG